MTHKLMIKDMKRVSALSTMNYIILSLTCLLFFLSMSLVYTREECKYKLCGIIMHPIKAIISFSDPLGTDGTKIPFIDIIIITIKL